MTRIGGEGGNVLLHEKEGFRVLNGILQATRATISTLRWLRRTEIGSSMTSGALAEKY